MPKSSPAARSSSTSAGFRSFTLSVLSRGKGVPPPAREALQKAREMVEGERARGVGVTVESRRLGIEGETQLCAEYEDPKAAAKAYERVSALVKGVDLANLAIGPCAKGGPGLKKGEEKQ